jgi:hypothetical protein
MINARSASAQRVKVHLPPDAAAAVNRSQREMLWNIKGKKCTPLYAHLARRSICNANGRWKCRYAPSRSLQTAGKH